MIDKAYLRKGVPRGGKLAQTTNFLDLYMYATGTSEVPRQYHLWSCISLVAASVGSRCFYRKFKWEALPPNMFIFLIGPSAVGKGGALGFAQQFRHERHNLFHGPSTHKALIDRMALEAPHNHPPFGQMWLLHPELADAVGTGGMADAFVKFMTNIYNPSQTPYMEATRTQGERVIVDDPCINWLAGSTSEWLRDAVTPRAMESGFFGRVVGVPAWYDLGHRVYNPMRFDPEDYDDVVGYLADRVNAMTMIPDGTEFKMTQRAEEIDEEWYMNRSEPPDALVPFFKREHDLSVKLSMILSLCRGMDFIIDVDDVLFAHDLVMAGRMAMPRIIRDATASNFARNMDFVEKVLKDYEGWMKRVTLLQRMRSKHVSASELDVIISELENLGYVEQRLRNKTAQYKWCKQEHLLQFKTAGGGQYGI